MQARSRTAGSRIAWSRTSSCSTQYPHAEDEYKKKYFDIPLHSDWELIEEGDPGHHIRPYQTSVAALKQAKLQDPEVLERRKNASRRFLSTWLQRARLAYRPLLCLRGADAEKKGQLAKQMDIDIERQRQESWDDNWTEKENEGRGTILRLFCDGAAAGLL